MRPGRVKNTKRAVMGVKAAFIFVAAFALFSLVPFRAYAATYTVCASGCDYSTINNALAASSSGDTITVSSGTYSERIDYGSKNVTIQSVSGAASTFIVGDGTDNPVIRFNNNGLTSSAVLKGFTINNAASGGNYRRGIYIGSSARPTIQDSVIKGNRPSSAVNGAGIYITGGSSGVTVTGTTFGGDAGDKNTSSRGTGLYATTTSGSITISNSTFSYNSAGVHGGAVYFLNVSSTPTFTNTTIDNNTAAQYGGAVFSNNSPFTITGGSISNNTATYDGGAIFMNVASNTLVINGSTTINNNTARAGGAIYASDITSVDITGGSLSNNTGTNDGGAIYSTGGVDVVITGATINNNATSGYGGGIYSVTSGATLTISKSFVQGNSCRDGGCGIYTGSGTTATITNAVITGNRQHTSSWRYGGGMYNAGTLYMYNSTIAGNYAYDGGGISASGTETIRNTIIYGNTAGYGSNNNVRSTINTSTNNNTGTNARFADLQQATSGTATTAGDYRLCYSSGVPAAGCTTISPDLDYGNATNAPVDDIIGTARPQDVAGIGDGVNDYDRGAYEHIAADVTPPANVTGFSVTNPATGNQLDLSWTNPGDADFSGVKIVRATGGTAPANCTGTAVYDGTGTSYNNTGLADGTQYSYRICSYDSTTNYASGVTGSGTPTDTAAPANVTGLAVNELNARVDLSWTNPVDADYAGTKILRKTGSYPGSCTDGTATTVFDSAATAYSDTGLTNGTTYYYRVCAHDEAPNYPSGVTVAATPFLDLTPPADVTGFSVSNLGFGNQLNLAWTNPVDSDFAAVKIVRAAGATAPSDCTGSAVYDGSLTAYADTGLTDGALYSYRVCAYDYSSNYAPGVTGSATPTDTLAPSGITGFTATNGNTQVTLVWTNPVETDFAGTKILRKTGAYPSSCTDGTATTVYNGTGATVDDTGLTNGTTYYYIGCAYDEAPNYSTSAAVTATPSIADITPPANITDLSSIAVYTRGIKLGWTAPGDDGSTGTATSYDLRYTDAQGYVAGMAAYLDVNWDTIEQASGEPAPRAGGSTEAFFFGINTSNVKMLPNTSYYNVMKSKDESNNISIISNEVTVHTALKYGYNYMSIPFDASTGMSATLQDMLGDDVPYVYIFKWTPTGLDWGSRFRGRWTRLSSTATVTSSFNNANGYYMYVYSANSSVLDEKNSGGTALVSENTDNWAKVDMVQGRNLVGNPYTKNVDFSNIKVCQNSSFTTSGGCSGGTINTFVDAVTAGWMGSTVAYYGNETTFTTEACSSIECAAKLRPWWGQWVYLLQSTNTYIMAVPKP